MAEGQAGRPGDEDSGVEVLGEWQAPGGVAVRVVRWLVRGRERALYRWARGLDFDAAPRAWTAGLALERRDGHGARWQTISRQEVEGSGRALPERRLRGWEAGLVARGVKLAARLGATVVQSRSD